MSEINKPQQFWIHKGTSNFCNELDYDIETEKLVKCRPDDFYDIVSTKDTIHSGIHVIELAPMLKMMETMAEALKFYDDQGPLWIEHADDYSDGIERLLEDDGEKSKKTLESYKAFKRENGLE